MFVQFRFNQEKIPIFAHQRVVENLKKRFDYLFDKQGDYPGSPHVYPNVIREGEIFKFDNISVVPITYMHHKLQVFGFRIENFAYVTDLKEIEELELDKLRGLDTLILNALRHKEHYSHISLTQALEIVEKTKTKKNIPDSYCT